MTKKHQAQQEIKTLVERLMSTPLELTFDATAQAITSCITTLDSRLDRSDLLTVAYSQNPQARGTLPYSIMKIIEKRVEGQFSEIEAREHLHRVSECYKSALERQRLRFVNYT